MTNTRGLYEAVAAVCPIESISYGRKDDKQTWRIDFLPEATDEQRAAAQAVVDAFDPSIDPPPVKTRIEKLADLMVANGLLTREEVDEALAT